MEAPKILEKATLPQPVDLRATTFWGMFFMIFGVIYLVMFFYAAVLSKLLPASRNQFISAIQNDRYYCLLVPLTLPVLVVAVYLHWLSMKLFKHAWLASCSWRIPELPLIWGVGCVSFRSSLEGRSCLHFLTGFRRELYNCDICFIPPKYLVSLL